MRASMVEIYITRVRSQGSRVVANQITGLELENYNSTILQLRGRLDTIQAGGFRDISYSDHCDYVTIYKLLADVYDRQLNITVDVPAVELRDRYVPKYEPIHSRVQLAINYAGGLRGDDLKARELLLKSHGLRERSKQRCTRIGRSMGLFKLSGGDHFASRAALNHSMTLVQSGATFEAAREERLRRGP